MRFLIQDTIKARPALRLLASQAGLAQWSPELGQKPPAWPAAPGLILAVAASVKSGPGIPGPRLRLGHGGLPVPVLSG